MRNFRSYVKSNPNDAVPTLRSLPEASAFINDLSSEIKVLSKYLKESSMAPDEFFDVYKLMLEKQQILANVRVIVKTRFATAALEKDSVVLLSNISVLNNKISDVLEFGLTDMSIHTGTIPNKISGMIHTILQSLQYESSSIVVVPEADSSKTYTACVSNLTLSGGSTYQRYFVCVRNVNKQWVAACSPSLPRFVAEDALEYKPFNTVKSGIKTIHNILSEEGVLIQATKFSLQPKRKHHAEKSDHT